MNNVALEGNPMTESQVVEEGLKTLSEAQQFVGVSRSGLYSLMERGELAYCKIGRRRLIPKRALIELAQRALVVRISS
jgi:excisionase family DNA binding protein